MEPIGFKGLNYLFAQLQQTLLIASPKFKTDRVPDIERFLLDFDPPEETFMTEEERKHHSAQQMKAFFSQFSSGKKEPGENP